MSFSVDAIESSNRNGSISTACFGKETTEALKSELIYEVQVLGYGRLEKFAFGDGFNRSMQHMR